MQFELNETEKKFLREHIEVDTELDAKRAIWLGRMFGISPREIVEGMKNVNEAVKRELYGV